MDIKTFRKSLLLFLAAVIWGVAFVSQSKGMEYMGPFTFNATRTLLGAAVLIPLIVFRRKKEGAGRREIPWKIILPGGICCGLALMAGSTLQQFGIMYTTVGKAGFITTLYIIFVPIAGIFIGRRAAPVVWVGAVLAAVGMYLLCISESFSVNKGDALVFVCALCFTVHIMVIDYFSPKADGVMISCVQFLVCGLVCLVPALIFEKPQMSQILSGWIPVFYAGVMSCGVAYTLQIVGQKDMNPTVAALVLSLESVISVIAGWAAYRVGFLKEDQTLSARQLAGCAIVFAAVILVQLPWERISLKKEKTAKENN